MRHAHKRPLFYCSQRYSQVKKYKVVLVKPITVKICKACEGYVIIDGVMTESRILTDKCLFVWLFVSVKGQDGIPGSVL